MVTSAIKKGELGSSPMWTIARRQVPRWPCVCVCVVSTEPTTTTTSLTEEAESSSEKMGDGSTGAQGDARNNIYDNGLFLLTLKWVSAR